MRIGSASRFAVGGALVVLMLATVPGTGLARRHEQKAPPPGRGEPARSASGPHPTLYFRPDAADFRNRGSEGVLKESRDLVLFTADWALRVKIPSEPARREKLPADGSYSTAGLVSAKDFLDAGVTIQSVVPVLGVAYHLTGDAKYARRAVEWLTAYSGWQNFDVSKPDIAGSGSVVGMTVGYDLLYHQMSPAERQRLLATITRVGTLYVAKARQLSKLPLRGNRVLIANDHNLVPVAAAGVAALLFKLEGVDNGEALDTVIACFRKSIIPAGFGPNGEFVDGTDNWLVYAMNSMTFFFEALRRNGGPNLWMEGNLPKVPEYWIQMDSIPAEDTPYNYRWRHTLLALASVYRNSELQGLALKHGLGITPEARQLNFTQQNAPEDAGKPVKRWWSAAWEFMFYDPSVKPAPLRSRPTSVAFPPRGDVILRSAWTKDATILTFRAGPRVGKAEGDNNAFQLKAVGHDFLPKLEVPFTRLTERGDASYDEMDKLLGTEGNNTIMVDGVRQYSRLDPR